MANWWDQPIWTIPSNVTPSNSPSWTPYHVASKKAMQNDQLVIVGSPLEMGKYGAMLGSMGAIIAAEPLIGGSAGMGATIASKKAATAAVVASTALPFATTALKVGGAVYGLDWLQKNWPIAVTLGGLVLAILIVRKK